MTSIAWAQKGDDDSIADPQQQETQPMPGAAEDEVENNADGEANTDKESKAADGNTRVSDDNTFVPSEEISEDLSVSFPIDI
jgi:hypothetical protein